MFGKTLVLFVLLASVVAVLGELPVTLTVGHRDGGFIGFRSSASLPFFLSTTPTGAFVVNYGPRDTLVEVTVPSNPANLGTFLEAHEEFGTTPAFAIRPKNPLTNERRIPPRSSAAEGSNIPLTEAALRTGQLSISNSLDIREHTAQIDPNQHPSGGGTLTMTNAQQWMLYSFEDFDVHGDGWAISKNGTMTPRIVGDKRQGCNGSPDLHLGGYCAFAGLDVSKVYRDLPPHSMLQITARIHFFDMWRGEYAYAKVNGNMVWQQSHAFCPKPFANYCKGVDACGDNKYSDKLSQHVKITIPHSESSFMLTFGSSLDVNPCTASWAIDDVAIYTKF